MSQPGMFARFFDDPWETRCWITSVSTEGRIRGKVELVMDGAVVCTIGAPGDFDNIEDLSSALVHDARRWLASQTRPSTFEHRPRKRKSAIPRDLGPVG